MLQARNPKRNANGTIDLEIEHPQHGWIPFTADANDVEEHGREIYRRADAGEYGTIEEQ